MNNGSLRNGYYFNFVHFSFVDHFSTEEPSNIGVILHEIKGLTLKNDIVD